MNKIAGLLAITCFAMFSGFVWAANGVPQQRGDPADRRFNRMDINGDGVISKKEFEQYYDKEFDALDVNHDGKITRKEIDAARERMRQAIRQHFRKEFKQQFDAADTNHDGALSKDEAKSMPGIEHRFDQIDANHDGKVTGQEIGNYLSSLGRNPR